MHVRMYIYKWSMYNVPMARPKDQGQGYIALAATATMLHRLHNPFTQMAF